MDNKFMDNISNSDKISNLLLFPNWDQNIWHIEDFAKTKNTMLGLYSTETN